LFPSRHWEEKESDPVIGFDEIQLDKSGGHTVVTLAIKKKLDKEDYDRFVPMIERQIENGAPIRLLVELHDFEGWTAGALWEDTKFAARHSNDIERLAVVGESRWHQGGRLFFKPFTAAEVRYFDRRDIDRARIWIRGW
jgi:hypothetical protein